MLIDEVVSQVDQYLSGYTSLEQFETWLYDLAFDIERRYSGEVVDLVHQLEGTLAESSSGHWTCALLENELDAAISPHRRYPLVIQYSEEHGEKKKVSSAPVVLLPRAIAL